jgi:hypothetical protein
MLMLATIGVFALITFIYILYWYIAPEGILRDWSLWLVLCLAVTHTGSIGILMGIANKENIEHVVKRFAFTTVAHIVAYFIVKWYRSPKDDCPNEKKKRKNSSLISEADALPSEPDYFSVISKYQ